MRPYRPTIKERTVKILAESTLVYQDEKNLSGELLIAPSKDIQIDPIFEPFVVKINTGEGSIKMRPVKYSGRGRPYSSRYAPKETKRYFRDFNVDDSELRITRPLDTIGRKIDDWKKDHSSTNFKDCYRKALYANFLRSAMNEDQGNLQKLLTLHAVTQQMKRDMYHVGRPKFRTSFDLYKPSEELEEKIQSADKHISLKRSFEIFYGLIDIQSELGFRRRRNESFRKRNS